MRVPTIKLRYAVLVAVVVLQLAAIAYIRSENKKTKAMQETIAKTQRTLGAMANVLTELNREHEGAITSAALQRTKRQQYHHHQQYHAEQQDEKKKNRDHTAVLGTVPAYEAIQREAEGRLIIAREQLRARVNEVCSLRRLLSLADDRLFCSNSELTSCSGRFEGRLTLYTCKGTILSKHVATRSTRSRRSCSGARSS